MTLREFERKLKKLNRGIAIYATGDLSRPAGVWYMNPTYHGGEYKELCGIEKFNLQEYPTYSKQGKMLKGGWHRVLTMLTGLKIINRTASYRYFGYWDEHREPFIIFDKSAIDTALSQLKPIAYRRGLSPLDDRTVIDIPVYDNDDTVDIGRMIAKDNQRYSPPPSLLGNGL